MESATVGQRIREARERIPLSQRELADRIEMSYAQLSRIEKGRSMPRPATVRLIAEKLGVSASWLATGKGEMRE